MKISGDRTIRSHYWSGEILNVLFDNFTGKLAELKQNSNISQEEEYFPVLFYFYLSIVSHILHTFHKPPVCMYFVI